LRRASSTIIGAVTGWNWNATMERVMKASAR
jgi:hypothetical protein